MRRVPHLILFILFAAPLVAAEPIDKLTPELAQRVSAAVQAEMEEQRIVGLAAGIVQRGEIVHLQGYGFSDREKQSPVTVDSMFRWASISKPVTAVAAMQLVEREKLDLDCDVRKYVPEFPDKGVKITARQLLCHQAGIVHYTNGEVIPTKREYDIEHPFESVILALDRFKDSPLVAPPREKFAYSTHGYILLSAVVQRAGEAEFAEQVRQRIVHPLGMQTLQPDYQWKEILHRAVGYRRLFLVAGPVVIQSSNTDVSWKLGGGGFISDIGDMARFAGGLLDGELVTAKSREILWTRQGIASGEETKYGLGFSVEGTGAERVISHNGRQEKTRTRMELHPTKRLAVVIMCNCEYANPQPVAKRIVDALSAAP